MSEFEGKSYIVTGAASGIGGAVAAALLSEGARVALFDMTAPEIPPSDSVIPMAGDVTSPDNVQQLVDAVVADWGGVDGLVHCAGVLRQGPVAETALEDWNLVVNVNLTGTFVVNQAVSRAMVAGGRGGCIVNIASISAAGGSPGLGAYSASKAGVVALTRSLATELRPQGVRVNYLSPGFVQSGMTQHMLTDEARVKAMSSGTATGSICQPSDIANAALFLLSDKAAYVAGHGLVVDSGSSIR